MSEGLPTKGQQWADFQRKQQQQEIRDRCYQEMLDLLKAWVALEGGTPEELASLAQRSAALIMEAEEALDRIE